MRRDCGAAAHLAVIASDAEGGAKQSRRLPAIAVRARLCVGSKARSEAECRSRRLRGQLPWGGRLARPATARVYDAAQAGSATARGRDGRATGFGARGAGGHGTPARWRGPACLTTNTQAKTRYWEGTHSVRKAARAERPLHRSNVALVHRWKGSTCGVRARESMSYAHMRSSTVIGKFII